MKRSMGVLALCFVASDAWAVGVGSTAAIGTGGFDLGLGLGGGGDVSTGGFAPSLDLHFSPVHLQIHLLEFTEALSQEDIFVGVNMYFDAVSSQVAGPWIGVVQPGFGLDLYGDPVTIALTGQCRLGPEASGSASFGVYVVPAVGILVADGDLEWIAGGSLQLSAWFGS